MSDVPTRLLRETLRTPLTPASTPGCMDTETLAAWSDDALSAREREAVESHAAVCARCQALLAAMARTTTHWRHSAAGGVRRSSAGSYRSPRQPLPLPCGSTC